MLQRHLMFYPLLIYNIRVTHRNGAIKHIFYESDPRRIISRLFFIHCKTMRLLFICDLKYYFKSFCVNFEHVSLVSVGCISTQNASRTALCYATNTIKWKHSHVDINHQQNTRRSDQIETIKTIMQTTRPRITWKVLPMAQVAIFKEIFDQVRKRFRLWIVYSELKRHNVSYIYYLLRSNIHRVRKR